MWSRLHHPPVTHCGSGHSIVEGVRIPVITPTGFVKETDGKA